MKIGIIVHSYTGNTLSVAQDLEKKLISVGHQVTLEKIVPHGGENTNENDSKKIRFDHSPVISGYEGLVFCGPVRGFNMSPVLSAYLSKIDGLKGKKAACLVTHFFPYHWMGGTRTAKQILERCKSKGADILDFGVIDWKNKNRQLEIDTEVEKISKLFI